MANEHPERRHGVAKHLALGLLCGLALHHLPVNAQVVTATDPTGTTFPTSTAGNTTTYGRNFAQPGNVAKMGIRFASDGTVLWDAPVRHPTPAGGSIPVTVTGSTPKVSVAGAIGRFMSKLYVPLVVGVALYDLAKELGFTVSNSGGGAVQVTRSEGKFRFYSGNNCGFQGVDRTIPEVVAAATVCYGAGTYTWGGPSGGLYELSRNGVGLSYFTLVSTSQQAATQQELVDAIAAKSGWPTSSALARATRDAVASGEQLEITPTSITGPATSPGPKTTKVDGATGNTTTTTTTNNYTYNGDTITNNTTTVTNVTNTATGAPVSTSTETTQPENQGSECEKNPSSIGCRNLDVPSDVIPAKSVEVTFAQEDIGFGGGSCPAPATVHTSNGDYTLDLAQYCDVVSSIVRPVIILLAAFAAFMIAVPAKEA